MRLPRKSVLLLTGAGALVASYVIVADCDAPDGRQYLGLFVLPAFAAVCFGAVGWLWPVSATTGRRLGVAIFCGGFLGAIGWFSVAAFFAGNCSR